MVPRRELAAPIAALFGLTPPLDADEAWRAQLVTRFGTVWPFFKLFETVVDFGAAPEALPVLVALKTLPDLMRRKNVGPAETDTSLLTGSWQRLVLSAPHLEPGTVDWKAYAFCVLEQMHRMLCRLEVFAKNSSKWGTRWRNYRTGTRGSRPTPTRRDVGVALLLCLTPRTEAPPECPARGEPGIDGAVSTTCSLNKQRRTVRVNRERVTKD
ncbi:hypothetical protein JOF35_005114 [Streptomyces demainii]|uniref:Transposase n=1 Tax=Streptomyces demainii TaxID=588122 RepID=A0ABT9KWP6_9ACTN|nr:hypothetical protein [Streptomyces demainii]MDP9612837.1 hypothetical protein [Streptomyces demainii]